MSEIQEAINSIKQNRYFGDGVMDLVLIALQEQADREKGCEYCNGDALGSLILITDFGEPRVALHGGNTQRDELEKPKFCPKCGRDLRKLVQK